jgi:cytochrome d ubiquinol oxidase subunit II
VGWLVRDRLEGWAFIATAFTIVAFFTTLMLNLYPDVLVSSISPQFNMTIVASASHHYTLMVMSWVALIFTPLVLLYQSWTYWIFKKRVRRPGTPSDPKRDTTSV